MYSKALGELEELDAFDQIAQSFGQTTQLASEDEFEDYNSRELYDPGKGRALAWWC